jgi:hypothetical protein
MVLVVTGEAAPAVSDLEDVIRGREVELATDAVVPG